MVSATLFASLLLGCGDGGSSSDVVTETTAHYRFNSSTGATCIDPDYQKTDLQGSYWSRKCSWYCTIYNGQYRYLKITWCTREDWDWKWRECDRNNYSPERISGQNCPYFNQPVSNEPHPYSVGYVGGVLKLEEGLK